MSPRKSNKTTAFNNMKGLVVTFAVVALILLCVLHDVVHATATLARPRDCRQILKHNMGAVSGNYTIYADGVTPAIVKCDMTLLGGGWTIFDYYPKSYDAPGNMTAPYLVRLNNTDAHVRANQIYFGGNSAADSTLENVFGEDILFLGVDSEFCSFQRFRSVNSLPQQPATVSVFTYEIGCLMTFQEGTFTELYHLVGFSDGESAFFHSGYEDNKYNYSFTFYMREYFECYRISEYDTEFVCNGNGVCNGTDLCICNEHYYGQECELTTCSGVQSNYPSVCSARGTCVSYNTCNCTEGYGENDCSLPVCFALPSNEKQVCSGHGVCDSPDICLCHFGYTGTNCSQKIDCNVTGACNCTEGYGDVDCQTPICHGILGSDTSVCSGNGACLIPNYCDCDPGYDGPDCSLVTCFGIPSNNPLSCGANGSCIGIDKCKCSDEYLGAECSYPICFSVDSRNVSACYGNGQCIAPNVCQCYEGYTGEMCTMPYCFGVFYTEPGVCNGHGSCSNKDTCKCNAGYTGPDCSIKTCHGISAQNSLVCSQHGVCVDVNQCLCLSGYYGTDCSDIECFSIPANDSRVCSNGRGACTGPNNCDCNEGYSGSDCSINDCVCVYMYSEDTCKGFDECLDFGHCGCDESIGNCSLSTCYGFTSSDSRVCSGKGICIGPNHCDCNEGYSGADCSVNDCVCVYMDSEDTCNGFGECVDFGQCGCDESIGNCSLPTCYGFTSSDSRVCSGKGICIGPNHCVCTNDGYTKDCSVPICYSVPGDSVNVCSGHGTCSKPDTCICPEGYGGNQCHTFTCSFFLPTDSEVCNGRGHCGSYNNCTCDSGFSGYNCETVDTCSGDYTLALLSSSNAQSVVLSDSSCETVLASIPTVQLATPQHVVFNGNALYLFKLDSIHVVPFTSTSTLSSTDLSISITSSALIGVQASQSALYAFATFNGVPTITKIDLTTKQRTSLSLTGYSVSSVFNSSQFMTLSNDSLFCIAQNSQGHAVLSVDALLTTYAPIFTFSTLDVESLLIINGLPTIIRKSTLYSIISGSLYHVNNLTTTAPISSKIESSNKTYLIRDKHITVLKKDDGSIDYERKLPNYSSKNFIFLGGWKPEISALSTNVALTTHNAVIGLTGANLVFGTKSTLTVRARKNTEFSFSLPLKSCVGLDVQADSCVETGIQNWGDILISNTTLSVAPVSGYKPVKLSDDFSIMFYKNQVNEISLTTAPQTVSGNVNVRVVYVSLTSNVKCKFTLGSTGSAETVGTVVLDTQVSCPLPKLDSFSGKLRVTISAEGLDYQSNAFITIFTPEHTVNEFDSLEAIGRLLETPASSGASRPSILEIVYVEKYANRTMLRYGSNLDPTKRERTTVQFKNKHQLYGNTISFDFLIPSATNVSANLIEQELRHGENYLMALIMQDALGSQTLGLMYKFGTDTETTSSSCSMEIGTLYSLQTKAITPETSRGKWTFQTRLMLDSAIVCEATIVSSLKLSILNPYIADTYDLLIGQSVGYGASTRKILVSQEINIFLSSASTGCEQASCDLATMPKAPVSPASKGWIAAAVIAPLFVIGVLISIAVLAVVVLLLIRRKSNTKAVSKMAAQNSHTFTENLEEMREI